MKIHINTDTRKNIIFILHIVVISIVITCSPPLIEPIICHTLSKPSITVSTPVCGFTETVPSISVVITKISIGITKHDATTI